MKILFIMKFGWIFDEAAHKEGGRTSASEIDGPAGHLGWRQRLDCSEYLLMLVRISQVIDRKCQNHERATTMSGCVLGRLIGEVRFANIPCPNWLQMRRNCQSSVLTINQL